MRRKRRRRSRKIREKDGKLFVPILILLISPHLDSDWNFEIHPKVPWLVTFLRGPRAHWNSFRRCQRDFKSKEVGSGVFKRPRTLRHPNADSFPRRVSAKNNQMILPEGSESFKSLATYNEKPASEKEGCYRWWSPTFIFPFCLSRDCSLECSAKADLSRT